MKSLPTFALLASITAMIPRLVEDLRSGASTNPRALADHFGRLLSDATDSSDRLFVTDGSPARLVRDIRLGSWGSAPMEMRPVGNRHLMFRANDASNGLEPWIRDGSAAGTRMVEVRTGATSSVPQSFTVAAGQVYFSADDGVHGNALWTWFPGATSRRIGTGCAASCMRAGAVQSTSACRPLATAIRSP